MDRSLNLAFRAGGAEVRCPDCRHELKPMDYKGIRIDECVHCRGRWFDRDELRQAKDRTDDDLRWLDFDPFGQGTDGKKSSRGKQCPRCALRMDAITYDQSSVTIDKCPRCLGVWLDHDEFQRIIRYLEQTLTTKSAKEYARLTFHEFVSIFTGPEGVKSEIKDFLAVLKLLELRIAVEHPGLATAYRTIFALAPFR